MYGFGGFSSALGYKQTSHCFPLTGDLDNPSVTGCEGVMELYSDTIKKIKMSGPTYFAPVIRECVNQVREEFEEGRYMYSILMMLTDGSICDMEETMRVIEEAASLPISLIIIGLGEEDYSSMEVLDCGEGSAKGVDFNPMRDVVQFVPYRKYANNAKLLAKEVLAEIP